MSSIDYKTFKGLNEKQKQMIMSSSYISLYQIKQKDLDMFNDEQLEFLFKGFGYNLEDVIRCERVKFDYTAAEFDEIMKFTKEMGCNEEWIGRCYLHNFLEKKTTSFFKERQDLVKIALDYLSKGYFKNWYASFTKEAIKELTKKLYVSVELYGEYFEYLRPYYNNLKLVNTELDSDAMKLYNKINGGENAKKKVTLYNTSGLISTGIRNYPIEDISKYQNRINWWLAKKKDPSLEDFLLENLNKPYNKNISYNVLLRYADAVQNFSISNKGQNHFKKFYEQKEKYPELYRNLFKEYLSNSYFSSLSRNQFTGHFIANDFFLIKSYKEEFISKFSFIKEDELERVLDIVDRTSKKNDSSWWSNYSVHRIFYHDNQKKKEIKINDRKDWEIVLSNCDKYAKSKEEDFELN